MLGAQDRSQEAHGLLGGAEKDAERAEAGNSEGSGTAKRSATLLLAVAAVATFVAVAAGTFAIKRSLSAPSRDLLAVGTTTPSPSASQRAVPSATSKLASAASQTTTAPATTTSSTSTRPPLGALQKKRFRLVENPDSSVAVRTSSGRYVSVSKSGKLSTVESIGKEELFKLLEHSDGTVTLEAWNKAYIAAKGDELKVTKKKGKEAKLKKVEEDDGAVMLETQDGSHVSSEAFSDKPGRFAIYTREASEAGDAEKFHVEVHHSDHTASLKSLHGTYLTVEGSGSVVAGSTQVGKQEKFKRHRNKDGTVSLTSHAGHYLTAMENGTVLAKSKKCEDWEKFQLIKQKDGTVSLKASNGRYISVSKLPIFAFYMYRAQGNNDYPWQSVNTGNLAGVMWYLHNEVVVETPRKYGISRIVRQKFQTTSTEALAELGLNFGVRFAYDTGMCTGAGPINGYASCRQFYERLGYFIGCNYLGDYPFPMASKGFPSFYEGGMWYSIPKEGACLGAPNGLNNCTYFSEDAGSIDIGDMYDLDDYWGWYNNPDSKEYVANTDSGVGCDFWAQKNDTKANAKRVNRALDLFREKFPDMPSDDDLPDPVCDFNCKRFYKGDDADAVREECQCSEREVAREFFPHTDLKECKLDTLSGLKNVGYYNSDSD